MSRLTDFEKNKIVELSSQGFSSRSISKTLWGTESRKSTVNDFLTIFRKDFVGVEEEYGPNVLILDIETAPTQAYVWRMFKENIGHNQVEEDWYMLSCAAKWLGSDDVFYWDCKDDLGNDRSVLAPLWALLDKADWVITHNGDRFDIPKIRSRMIINKMPPFSPVKSIDTCKAAKKAFGFTRNTLEYLTETLCPETCKSSHKKFPGFSLWRECLAGNEEAWEEMKEYNKQDVISLEALYYKLRPWIPQHPNFSLYVSDTDASCNCCGGKDLELWHTKAYTSLSEFDLYRCCSCGTFKRGRKNNLPKEKMQNVLSNVS